MKSYIYGIVISTVISVVSYALYNFHYRVISSLEKRVNVLTKESGDKDLTIKNLGVEITSLVADNKVKGFEEYFNGRLDQNNTYSDKPIF